VAINRVEGVDCIPGDDVFAKLHVLAHGKRNALSAAGNRNAKLLVTKGLTDVGVASHE
jgi:hypothetical protein